jgi:hypothetical protein
MSSAIVIYLKAELAKLEALLSPAEKVVVADAEAIGTSAVTYIKSNGLTALYTIATQTLLGTASGTPWLTLMASVVTQAEAAGMTIIKGAESVVLGQAQADLIAAGKLLPPTLDNSGTGAVAS